MSGELPNPFGYVKTGTTSILNFFTGSDMSVVLTIFMAFVIFGIGGVVMYEIILPNIKTQTANNVVAMIGGILLLYIIFQFAGKEGSLFGTKFDMGLLMYILVVVGLIIVFAG